MKVGLFSLGISSGTFPGVIRATAQHAERLGFATLWAPEHVVLFDRQESRYPYSSNGDFPAPGDFEWIDPFVALTYAAAVTSSIRLATGICLVPEHNPVVLAKRIASLDRVSGGRFALGVGIGWSAEEFRALGVPFEHRGRRTREYIELMRRLWSDGATSFDGEFLSLDSANCYPKPARGSNLPVIFGGESIPALKRVADLGNGWYGFNLNPAEAGSKIETLRGLLNERGRDPAEVEIVVSPYTQRIVPDDLRSYDEAGVDEVVIASVPPRAEAEVREWLERMARTWLEPAARLG